MRRQLALITRRGSATHAPWEGDQKIRVEEALLKSSRQKNFDVMGGLVWKQFRYTPKSPKILGLWLADPTGGKRKQ